MSFFTSDAFKLLLIVCFFLSIQGGVLPAEETWDLDDEWGEDVEMDEGSAERIEEPIRTEPVTLLSSSVFSIETEVLISDDNSGCYTSSFNYKHSYDTSYQSYAEAYNYSDAPEKFQYYEETNEYASDFNYDYASDYQHEFDYDRYGREYYNFNQGEQNSIHIESITDENKTTYNNYGVEFDVQIQRTSDFGRETIMYTTTGTNLSAIGDRVYSMEEALTGANLANGVEKLFQNSGDYLVNNIERVDFVYQEGITINDSSQLQGGISLFERNSNGTIKIAAITSVDENGEATSFGTLKTIDFNDWGDPLEDLGDYTQDSHTMSVTDWDINNPDKYTYEFNTTQSAGGTQVSFEDLGVAAKDTIYGYAIFGGDVEDTKEIPIDVTDPYYKTDTDYLDGGVALYGSAIVMEESVNINSMFGSRSFIWDRNGNTSGYGTTLDGTWSNQFIHNNWTKTTAGNTTTKPWLGGSKARFLGTDSSGSYDVEVDGYVVARGMEFTGSDVTLKDTNGAQGKIRLENGNAYPVIDVDTGVTVTVDVNLVGNDGLGKKGSGNLVIKKANTLSGRIAVQSGTLTLDSSSGPAFANATKLIVKSAGTVAFNQDNQLSTNTDVKLSGTLETNGTTQVFDTLTLKGNSTIDLGAYGAGDLYFSDSSMKLWTSGATLNITNWQGDINGGTQSRIFFGNSAGGLTSGQLAQITFDGQEVTILSTGELVTVTPEPSAIIGGAFLVGIAAMHAYRKRKKLLLDQENEEDEKTVEES